MHIVFLNGSEFRGTWHDLTRALWHPHFISLVLGMTAILLVVRPYEHILPQGIMLQTLIIASCVIIFLGTSLLLLSRSARRGARIASLVFIIPSVATASVWGVGSSAIAGGQALDMLGWAQMLAFNLVFCILGEIFLATFLLQRIAVETGLKALPIAALPPADAPPAAKSPDSGMQKMAAIAPKPPQDHSLEILGQKLALADIWHLKAEEHYVQVWLRDGKPLLLRGRLADAIAQLPEGSGMQVHRSHWVANKAVAALDRQRDGWRLQIRTGQEVPVARNRQADVRDWIEGILETA